MEFLAFPAAALGILLLWAAGVPLLAAIFVGPAVALGILAVALQLLWPAHPHKKAVPTTGIKIARDDPRPKRTASRPSESPESPKTPESTPSAEDKR